MKYVWEMRLRRRGLHEEELASQQMDPLHLVDMPGVLQFLLDLGDILLADSCARRQGKTVPGTKAGR